MQILIENVFRKKITATLLIILYLITFILSIEGHFYNEM